MDVFSINSMFSMDPMRFEGPYFFRGFVPTLDFELVLGFGNKVHREFGWVPMFQSNFPSWHPLKHPGSQSPCLKLKTVVLFWMMINPQNKKWWFVNQPIENGLGGGNSNMFSPLYSWGR